jgi:hypothetical protein
LFLCKYIRKEIQVVRCQKETNEVGFHYLK